MRATAHVYVDGNGLEHRIDDRRLYTDRWGYYMASLCGRRILPIPANETDGDRCPVCFSE